MPIHELLFELLPREGDWISRAAGIAALGERTESPVDGETFDQCVWQLGDRVVWSPHDNLVKRKLANDSPVLPRAIAREADIEPWFEQFLWKLARPQFYDPSPPSFNLIIQNTARVGSPSGRWTRPDLCMACISRYHYSPATIFDLFSFELKMPEGCNMLAVHEALAHAATAHFPYLCLYLPENAGAQSALPSMLEQAQHHGVGVIRMKDPLQFATYQVLLTARRHEPSPPKIDGFIDDRFDEANKLALRRWIRK